MGRREGGVRGAEASNPRRVHPILPLPLRRSSLLFGFFLSLARAPRGVPLPRRAFAFLGAPSRVFGVSHRRSGKRRPPPLLLRLPSVRGRSHLHDPLQQRASHAVRQRAHAPFHRRPRSASLVLVARVRLARRDSREIRRLVFQPRRLQRVERRRLGVERNERGVFAPSPALVANTHRALEVRRGDPPEATPDVRRFRPGFASRLRSRTRSRTPESYGDGVGPRGDAEHARNLAVDVPASESTEVCRGGAGAFRARQVQRPRFDHAQTPRRVSASAERLAR